MVADIERISLRPERADRLLAVGAALMLAAALAALARGHADWPNVPAIIWVHVALILVALVLTPVMLLRRRGDRWHRRLGWVWCIALMGTALASFFVRVISPGHLGPIHILSAWTLIQVPLIVRNARRHDVARHRRAVRLMVLGALILAGMFTLLPKRMLGHWLFG